MSRVPLRQTPKRFFVDPSLAVAALETGPDRLRSEVNNFGLVFENLVMRDLMDYAEANGCAAHHYRDKSGLEADAIIQRRSDGRWIAVEVKLGGADAVDHAASERRRQPHRPCGQAVGDNGVRLRLRTPRRSGCSPNHRPRPIAGRAQQRYDLGLHCRRPTMRRRGRQAHQPTRQPSPSGPTLPVAVTARRCGPVRMCRVGRCRLRSTCQ